MKLTLDKTWTLCLRMWKWIAKEIEKGTDSDVVDLKRQWLAEHGFNPNEIKSGCFFCEYDCRQEDEVYLACCAYCPGRLVLKPFRCDRISYDYFDKSIRFYKKLVELNNKRLEQSKK